MPSFVKMINRSSRRQPPTSILPATLKGQAVSTEKPNVRIYILCHNEQRLAQAKSMFGHYYWAVPIRMKYQDVTFENAFWRQLLEIESEWRNCEMVGTLSSSAYTKVKIGDIDRIVRSRSAWASGFYHFVDTGAPLTHNAHPHLMTIVSDVVTKLGLPQPTANFYNYWMCTPAKMRAFIQWFESTLKPVVLAHPLSMEDAKYTGALTAEQCRQMCGVPYYPHVPFVLERINTTFFTINPINTEISRPNVRIYVLCHNEERFAMAKVKYAKYYWAVPIVMKYQDCTQENAFWEQLGEIEDEWRECKMVGTISSIAYTKVNLDDMDAIIRNQEQRSSEYHHFADTDTPVVYSHHPHMHTIIHDIAKALDLPIPTENMFNYWMCSPPLMKRFIHWYKNIYKNTVLNHPLAMTDSRYDGSLTLEQRRNRFGVPYYPHVPFVMERMNKCFFMKYVKPQNNRVFIVGGVSEGGSAKFIKDLLHIYPNAIRIANKNILQQTSFTTKDIMFIQHLFRTDITPADILSTTPCIRVVNIHDFTWLNSNNPHQEYLRREATISNDIKHMLETATLVVHPSQFTWDIYAHLLSTHNFILSRHIDYAIPPHIAPVVPFIRNKQINVGVLHSFTQYKGSEVLGHLMNKFPIYKGYMLNFVIPGVTVPSYDEAGFFDYINKYKIHGLTLLNKWGETYCYTLTKYLMTGLPIVYNNIGAPCERLSAAEHMIPAINNEDEYRKDSPIIEKAFTRFLDYIIEHAGTGVYVNPEITWDVPPLYKRLLDKPTPTTDIVMINSAICTSNTTLSYTKNRSVYSHEQRFAQTLETIASIYKFLPGAFIMMVDNTNLPELWKSILNTLIDKPFFLYNDPVQSELTNNCPYKGVAESHQLLHMLQYIDKNPEFSVVKNIYKITGRYSLTDSFSVTHFDNSDIVFKQIEPTSPLFEKEPACYTSFFKVPYLLRDEFRQSLLQMINKGSTGKSMECIVPYEFTSTVHLIDTLGIRGMIGPFGIECKA